MFIPKLIAYPMIFIMGGILMYVICRMYRRYFPKKQSQEEVNRRRVVDKINEWTGVDASTWPVIIGEVIYPVKGKIVRESVQDFILRSACKADLIFLDLENGSTYFDYPDPDHPDLPIEGFVPLSNLKHPFRWNAELGRGDDDTFIYLRDDEDLVKLIARDKEKSSDRQWLAVFEFVTTHHNMWHDWYMQIAPYARALFERHKEKNKSGEEKAFRLAFQAGPPICAIHDIDWEQLKKDAPELIA